MIVYLDSLASDRSTPPPWLVGASGLCSRETGDGRLWGVGDAYCLGIPQGMPTEPIADGWSACVVSDAEVHRLRRAQLWCDTGSVLDIHGREWAVPIIRTPEGARAFRVAYGRDWLPALTPEQTRAEAIVDAASDALRAGGGIDMPVACQWAAELLCMSSHLSPETIAALRLADEMVVLQTLAMACGLPLRVHS